ncbi:hypothetical protein [Psychrobacillus psychrodurans]|uniref:hypothetical protein n=1 Tax=Psychrobacillus psychrodurans TaxID=126157 RepID=UPI003D0906C5
MGKAATKQTIKKNEVTTYKDFVDRSVVGDNLEGHETLHPYKGKLNPFYPMDETTRGAFQKVDSINYWKIRGEEALGGK